MGRQVSWVSPILRVQRPSTKVSTTPSQPMIRLRAAKPDDVATLQRWDSEPHVAAISGTDGGMNWERDIAYGHPWQKILISELATKEDSVRAIGVVVIIDPAEEETAYWAPVERNLRAIDIWIGEKDCLARGYGTSIMAQALEICFSEGCDAVLVDPLVSNVRAHKFYKKMGFRETGVRQFGGDTCLVHRIEREEYERNETR